jgi:tetratricopeptide (TPR) repeat protein
MKYADNRHNNIMERLIFEFLDMSQLGTVAFVEETVLLKMLHYCETTRSMDNGIPTVSLIVEHAIAQFPFSVVLYKKKAEYLIRTDKYEQALVTIQHAELFAPKEVELKLLRAELLFLLGDVNESLIVLDVLKDCSRKEIVSEVYCNEAEIFENLREYKNMFKSLKRALLANPNNKAAAEKLFWAVEYASCFEESVLLNERLTDIDAFNAYAWYNLAHALSHLNRTEDAIEAYEFAYCIDERMLNAYRGCVELLIQTHQYAKALRCYENAMDYIEPDVLILHEIAFCYSQLNQWAAARIYYLRALEVNPDYADTHYRLGQCFSREGNWNHAIDNYLKAISLESRREDFYIAIAEAYYKNLDYTKAHSYFRKATHTAPEEAIYWVAFARFLIDTHRLKKAQSVLDEGDLHAFGTELKYCRVLCLLLIGKQAKALYILQEALEEDFDGHRILFEWRPELVFNQDLIASIADYEKKQ